MSTQRQSGWDYGRFLSTLNFFGEIPFLGSFRWIQQMLGQRQMFSGKAMDASKRRILVVGEETSIWCDRLQAYWLRSQPSSSMDFQSLSWEAMTTDPSHKVSSQQLQGIDSVVVSQIPQPFTLLLTLAQAWAAQGSALYQNVFDFTDCALNLSAWGALDDVVMGGVSEGRLFRGAPGSGAKFSALDNSGGSGNTAGDQRGEVSPEDPHACCAVFAGTVSTDNSGGFSSVRTQNFEPPFDFSGWSGMRLLVKGDGQRYKFILRNSSGWDSPAYIYSFDTKAGHWQVIDVPFCDLLATFRARSLPDAPPFDPAKACSFQIMLSKFEVDRKLNPHFTPGPFELQISEIGLYRPRSNAPWLILTPSELAEGRPQDDKLKGVSELTGDQQAELAATGLDYRLVPDQDFATVLKLIQEQGK